MTRHKKQVSVATTQKPVLLWIGDAVVHTGFASVTHSVLEHLHNTWDVHVLGINYHGDPHPYPYAIWPALRSQGDIYGLERLPGMLHTLKPRVVCMLNDPWVLQHYIPVIQGYNDNLHKQHLARLEKDPKAAAPVYTESVAYVPIDALNIGPDFMESMNKLSRVVAYTKFGENEMQKAGLSVATSVIPHGIDTSVYYPMTKAEARKALGLPEDWFIVGCVNRNQPRKRIDLTFQYFAEWAENKPANVKLYYHGALQDVGWNIVDLARFFGIEDRLVITSERITASSGVSRDIMRAVYSAFDMQMSTTMGEGWGLCQMEGMACGIPQIVPEWAALAEWPKDVSIQVPCTAIGVHAGGINTVGGIADRVAFIEALDKLYTDTPLRTKLGRDSKNLVTSPTFQWKSIAKSFDRVFSEVIKA